MHLTQIMFQYEAYLSLHDRFHRYDVNVPFIRIDRKLRLIKEHFLPAAVTG